MCEGTIDVEPYIGILKRHMLTPTHQGNVSSWPYSAVLQQYGFVDTVHSPDLSPFENVCSFPLSKLKQLV